MKTNRHHLAKRAFYWISILVITLGMCAAFIRGLRWEEPRLALSQLMNGTAERPFVYRVLVPSIIKAAVQLYPIPPTYYASLLIYVSLFGFALTIRSFAALYWNSERLLDSIGIISVIGLFPLMLSNRHVYDLSTLFLFSLSLFCMAKSKWPMYFIVYSLSCLNKETTILLTLVFFVCFGNEYREKHFWKLLGLQLLIYTSIRLVLMWFFRNNPGMVMEKHFIAHLYLFERIPALALCYTSCVLLISVIIIKDWRKKPVFLKQATLGLIPALFGLYLLWGVPLEIRVFYEAYPVVLLMVLPTIGPVIGLTFITDQQPLSTTFSDF